MTDSIDAARRSLLGRAALVLAALGGLDLASRSESETRSPPARETLRLYGQRWHRRSERLRPGAPARLGDRVLVYGELMDAPDGEKLGEFYATCDCTHAPFGLGPAAAAHIEHHVLQLPGGSIIGSGATLPEGESEYAIIGGTGRYAGAQGSYTAWQRPLESGGDGRAELHLDIMFAAGPSLAHG